VSVVIPHHGLERISHLKTCLRHLKRCNDVDEIIVAEIGPEPQCLAEIADQADKLIFVESSGLFRRGHALNVGAAIAEHRLVLWLDNDLIVTDGFVSEAMRELDRNHADVLIPYSHILYLDEANSRKVFSGEREADSLPYVKRLRAGKDVIGGAALVKRDFLDEHGGFEAQFEGWGGEDNAWYHKSRLFGRVHISSNAGQTLYHLYHTNSGANDSGVSAIKNNPKYAFNLRLLEQIKRIRDKASYSRKFPSNRFPAPWLHLRSLHLVLLDRSEAIDSLARQIESELKNLFHLAVIVSGSFDSLSGEAADRSRACIYLRAAPLSSDAGESLGRIVGRQVPCLEINFSDRASTVNGAVSLAAHRQGMPPNRRPGCGLKVWPKPLFNGVDDPFYTLVQALTYALGAAPSQANQNGIGGLPGPVWLYWEGATPDWILACRETICRNAPEVRLLDAAGFEKLRKHDLDIRLETLPIALKADFIRAHLLAHYGGFWLDSDCILSRDISPLLKQLNAHDFIAHRERSGLVSNAFIGARPNSRIASRYYARVCSVLRSGRPLGWTSLGSEPLTKILDHAEEHWLELDCDLVQPVCWSKPEVFFATGPKSAHQGRFDEKPWCYMLSNQEVVKYVKTHPGKSLLHEGTFFRFLLHQALTRPPASAENGEAARGSADMSDNLKSIFHSQYQKNLFIAGESISGPGSTMARTENIRKAIPRLLRKYAIKSLVDAPCGDFYWFQHIVGEVENYVGVDIVAPMVDANNKRYGGKKVQFKNLDLVESLLPEADLIFSRDLLVHLPLATVKQAIKNFKASKSRYLLMTTFMSYRENRDIKAGDWRPINFLLEPYCLPIPLEIIYEKCDENNGVYADKCLGLWALNDIDMAGW